MLLSMLLQASGGSSLMSFLPLILIVIVFYFFIIRPQQKKAKEQVKFTDSLEKGKQVVTASGIIGRINKIEGNIIHLQVDVKTFLRVTKNSISKDLTEAVEPMNDGF